MELHLFSTPGPGLDVRWVLDACKEVLREKRDATIAYLPQASLVADRWLRESQRAFHELGRITMIDTENSLLADMEAVLRGAALAYIPGGNAFLLNHRLHASRLLPALKKKIQNGLPVVAFSAGAVACGPNVLTSNDLNLVPTPHFNSLGVIPFNINVHYQDSASRDDWLGEYHSFHDNAVIMLADGAYLKVAGKSTMLVRGEGWLWRAGSQKEQLEPGKTISAH